MEILTAQEMAAVDRKTAEEFGVPLTQLMENAGTAVARFCERQFPDAREIVVLCGKGNNGGDGAVAARLLSEAGRRVRVILLGREDEMKGEARVAMDRLCVEARVVEVLRLGDVAALASAGEWIDAADLMIDAVVGTGFKPPLRGLVMDLQDLVAQAEVPVISVDVPSGWDADSTEQRAEGAFRADAVVTFTRPKKAHVFGHLTRGTFGPVVVAGIGSPDAAVESRSRLRWAGWAKAIAERARDVNSNKGMYGHVLVVGGSDGTAGAPTMASLAALRAGAGLVTAAVPRCVAGLVGGSALELMVAPLLEDAEGAVSLENLRPEGLERAILEKRISVIAVGPGLSTRGDVSEFARQLVGRRVADKDGRVLPMVIDADALNAFAGRVAELNGEGRAMVLTPHPGEMARLAGMSVAEVQKNRVGLARRFAMEHKVTLVLKGWRTLIAHPNGSVAVNTSGNPAMAKGGSGDILTGIVAAMLAQYARSGAAEEVARAVEAAVYLHGLAADFAAQASDEHTVLATDTVAHLSDAFRYRVRDADGMTWICGLQGER